MSFKPLKLKSLKIEEDEDFEEPVRVSPKGKSSEKSVLKWHKKKPTRLPTIYEDRVMDMKAHRCSGKTVSGARCSRIVCGRKRKCWQH